MVAQDIVSIAERYGKAVAEKYGNNRIFLFGSYAKGNFHKDSDIDIAVIFEDYSRSLDMQLELMKLRRNIDIRIEPIPFREGEFEPSNPLVFEIMKHGQELKIGGV